MHFIFTLHRYLHSSLSPSEDWMLSQSPPSPAQQTRASRGRKGSRGSARTELSFTSTKVDTMARYSRFMEIIGRYLSSRHVSDV